jgi:hypothetical protein
MSSIFSLFDFIAEAYEQNMTLDESKVDMLIEMPQHYDMAYHCMCILEDLLENAKILQIIPAEQMYREPLQEAFDDFFDDHHAAKSDEEFVDWMIVKFLLIEDLNDKHVIRLKNALIKNVML